MRSRILLLITFFSLVIGSRHCTAAENTRPVDEATARKHLLHYAEPVYPPIAKAARVQGIVEIAVVIDASGKVTSENVLSGPAMLQQASLDAVHTWTFKPFRMNGAIVAVSAVFQIPFQIDPPGAGPTKEQQEAAQAWFPASDKCRNALQQMHVDDALTFCKQALDLALKAGDTNSSDQLGLLTSHQYYGHALLEAGKPVSAMAEESEAVREAKQWLKPIDQEYAMPFFWRALAEAQLGLADQTFADLQIAEETHRRAIINLPEMKPSYSKYLVSILRTHARMLEQLGRHDEAAKLTAEADTLVPANPPSAQ